MKTTQELSENDFKKLGDCSYSDIEGDKEKEREKLKDAYYNIIDILKTYLDLKEEYYNIIALWIIGTYFHENFKSYPFLFFNAIKGSGKSRTLKIITGLSKDGEMLLSPTEAVLFRTKGTLGIDEFEGLGRKDKNSSGIDAIRELLNASYKKGSKIKRMKQKKTFEGTTQIVEEFDVYRPIVMANIWGMESVLGDRCIELILEKSQNKKITNLVEIFDEETIFIETKKMLNLVELVHSGVISGNVYREWNNYILNNSTNITNYINNTNYINYTQAFKTINSMDLRGREIELSLPLCLVALLIDPENLDILKITALTLKKIFDDKKNEEMNENKDIILIDFLSQELPTDKYVSVKSLFEKFKEFCGTSEDWFNVKWFGRALKRMNLIKQKRKMSAGVEILVDFKKAQDKIKMYKPEDQKSI